VRRTARGDEIACYQKTVTPLFAMYSAKSTSFGGFELKRDREGAQKPSFLPSFQIRAELFPKLS
jgi:hypothetical protein